MQRKGQSTFVCIEICQQEITQYAKAAITLQLIKKRAYEKESILRTLGAKGISINNEFEKNEIRLLASKLDGTSMADSFVVSSK